MESSTGELDGTVEKYWCEVLSVTEAADDENFFAAGGNSLLALNLANLLEEELGGEFPLEVIFGEGTLAAVKSAARDMASGD